MRDPVWANTFEDRSGNVTQHANFLCICFSICAYACVCHVYYWEQTAAFFFYVRWLQLQVSLHKDNARGGGACNLWGGLCFLQNLWSPTASKHVCDVSEMSRCTRPSCLWQGCPVWAQYRFHLASQMFPTTDSKWALDRENGLFKRDIDQCFIYSCFKMLYEHDYFLKSFWAWCPEINSSNQFGHLSLCILTIRYSTVVQDRRTKLVETKR